MGQDGAKEVELNERERGHLKAEARADYGKPNAQSSLQMVFFKASTPRDFQRRGGTSKSQDAVKSHLADVDGTMEYINRQ